MTRFALPLVLAALIAAAPAAAIAQPNKSAGLAVPVVGAAAGTTFNGNFTLNRFATNAAGQLVAVGTLAGTLTNTANNTVTSIVQAISLPVAQVTGTCEILHLDIGPIALNLLGLQVNLSEIILDITAQSGAGNLLGNLLCSVAHLLDNPSGLANLLNQILGAL
jgi:hypothetical protein